ncbi:Pre-mRNA-splicing factor SPF27 [Neurospora tetraspora]|uniref:Pre-mRNA-splicing factor SPF27 n=1 Tax=Neurospora tetraspora TaxID=94610 RepID=A0AAE0JL31_9PEZI|nr:Pre-mRNA-splicing factor SPF27 [Neurospora tetraspora]
MPLITTIHESLPYIDPEPTPSDRSAAEALIATERSLVPDDPYHALLPPPYSPSSHLTPLLQSEFDRIASSLATNPDAPPKLNALDLSRYSSLPEIPTPSDLTAMDSSEASTLLSSLLEKAYTDHAYVAQRRAHLALLDAYGKNAWLIGNWQLEGELKAIEKELAEAKREIDLVTLQRKQAQDEAGPEILGLEDTWKKGVGRVLETEAAVEGLRRQVLEVRRGME